MAIRQEKFIEDTVSILKKMPKLEVLQILVGHKGRVWGATWNPINTAIATYVLIIFCICHAIE